MTAVSYSVRSHAPHWWEAMGCASSRHWVNGLRLPSSSRSRVNCFASMFYVCFMSQRKRLMNALNAM